MVTRCMVVWHHRMALNQRFSKYFEFGTCSNPEISPRYVFRREESKNGTKKALKSKIYTIFGYFHPEAKIAEKNDVAHLILEFFLLDINLDTIIFIWYQFGEKFLFRSLPMMVQSLAFYSGLGKMHYRGINLSYIVYPGELNFEWVSIIKTWCLSHVILR